MRHFFSKSAHLDAKTFLLLCLLLTWNSLLGQVKQIEKQPRSPQTQPTRTDKVNWREADAHTGTTFMDLQEAFRLDWQGRKPKKGEGFKPFKRWEEFMAPRVYPSGDMSLPSTTYSNFIDWQKQHTPQDNRARIGATTSSGNWTELGPLSKPTGYDAGVGRIDFVRFDPSNTNILYVCSPDGGLWKSVDGGANWTTNTDFLPIIGCADLVIDPTNTQVMYLATGNREFDRSSIGILKSTDGGTTWNPTALVIPPSDGNTIRRLIMDPTNPQIMIAVLNTGIRRTTDGWNTFTQPAVPGNTDLQDVEFKPGDPTTVYAIGKDFFKSTDKGLTWTQVTTGLPDGSETIRALIAVTAADPNYVYAIYGNNTGGYLGTYRSTNSGTSFTAQSTFASLNNNILNCDTLTTSPNGQASHNLAIVVSPTNADSVSIGGCNVWQSGDGGVTWTLSSYWLGFDSAYPTESPVASPSYVHADIQSLEYQPGSNSILYVTSDGGISKSTTGGNKKWTDISTNLRVAQMTNVGQSSLTPYNMITGLQDIGTLKNSNGNWFVTNGGDGEDGFIDRTNDNVIITSNPNGAFALSTDGGITRTDITGLPAGLEFFSPIVQDPVDANVVYAGGREQLYKSTTVLSNPTSTWIALGTPAGNNPGGINRIAIAPGNNQILYVLKQNRISKSTNGGTTFNDITGTLPVNLAQLTNVAVSNTDADKVWVTFSGYEPNEKVYQSTNGGTTWVNISSGLPNIPMNTLAYTNNSPIDAIYVGADIGVYYMDNNTAWTPFFTGLPNNHVNDLEIYYPTSKIRAATYGRGLWESDLYASTCIKPDAGKDSLVACAPGGSLPASLDLKDAGAGQKWKVLSAPSGANITISTPSGQVSPQSPATSLLAGEYQFLLQSQSDSLNCRDTVTITIQNCTSGCFTISVQDDGRDTLCSGYYGESMNVKVGNNKPINFVQFTTPQTSTTVYSGGTLLASAVPADSLASWPNGLPGSQFPANNGTTPINYYVYAISADTTGLPLNCRPFGEKRYTILPLPSVSQSTVPVCQDSTRYTVNINLPAGTYTLTLARSIGSVGNGPVPQDVIQTINSATSTAALTLAVADSAAMLIITNELTGCASAVAIINPRFIVCSSRADVALSKTIDKQMAMVGDFVNYTIKVWNEGQSTITGVEVTDSLNAGVQYITHATAIGNYNPNTGIWTVGTLAAGDTATISIGVQVVAQGVWFNSAEVTRMNEQDSDSSPGNGLESEDDYSRVCFTVPIQLCRGQGVSVDLAVPQQYTGVVWFRKVQGGTPVQVGTGNTYLATETELGTYEYTYTSVSGNCPYDGCCPIILVVEDCCPIQVCVPITIERLKRK